MPKNINQPKSQSKYKRPSLQDPQSIEKKFLEKMKEIEIRQHNLADLEARLESIRTECAPLVDEYETEISELEEEIVHKLYEHLRKSKFSKAIKSQVWEVIEEFSLRLVDKGRGENVQNILKELNAHGKTNKQDFDEEIEEDFFELNDDQRFEKNDRSIEFPSIHKHSPDGPLKDLYRTLARSLHPDLEQDVKSKIEKTKLMQKATVAYNQKDLFTLLQIQAELMGEKNEIPSRFHPYIELLNQKIAEIKSREDELKHYGPLAFYYSHFYGKKEEIVKRKMRLYEAYAQEQLSLLMEMQEQVHTVGGIKDLFSSSPSYGEFELW